MRYWIVIICCLLFLKPALAQDADTDRYDLAFRSDNCIVLFDVETDDQSLLTPSVLEPTTENPHPKYCDQFDPVWSPDGKQVAFTMFNGTSERAGAMNNDVYIVDADGNHLRNLGDQEVNIEANPSWSPDGKRIVFSSNAFWYNGGNGTSDFINLFVMDVDGSNVQTLTPEPVSFTGEIGRPQWSPDGRFIAFNGLSVYWMDAEPRRIRLNIGDSSGFNPVWSPDGSRIAYLTAKEDTMAVMEMVISSQGIAGLPHTIVQLASDDVGIEYFILDGDSKLAWSPNGKWLLVVVEKEQKSDIYLIQVGSGESVNLTDHERSNYCPVWSPDSQQIAFLSERDGQTDIYLMNADGSGLRNLTNDDVPQQCPSWRP